MKTTLKMTLLAAAGVALLAAAPASAQTNRHVANAKAARVHVPAGGVYLLENGAPVYGRAGANTNAAEGFQDQFAISY